MPIEYTRRDERTRVMQALYQVFLFIENKEENIDATDIITSIYQVDDFSKVPAFSKIVYTTALDKMDEIKAEISKHLVKWTFDRLDNVAKAILVTSVTEGNYIQIAPRKVVINEGVNLAKNYLKANDYKFINAVLDKSIKEYQIESK